MIFNFLVTPKDSILFYCSQSYVGTTKYLIYKLNLNTSEKTILKEYSEFLFLGDCSFDGSDILYQSQVNGKGDIGLLNLINGTDNQITNSEYHDHDPKFNKYLDLKIE